MEDINILFGNWLNSILEDFKVDSNAYCFNIYKEKAHCVYALELTAFAEYDEKDDDWACEGEELYASRNENHVFVFYVEGGWKNCLRLVGSLIEEYLKNGKYSSLLKNSQAVAFGFVDGALNIAYRNLGCEKFSQSV